MSIIRLAKVAGAFYENEVEKLSANLSNLWPQENIQPKKCLGAVIPHAGYIYSGPVAAQVYANMELAETYILLGPNHTGLGERLALANHTYWETPLGRVKVNQDICQEILTKCPDVRKNNQAHAEEHALEVQLPFLQYIKANKREKIKIVPLIIHE